MFSSLLPCVLIQLCASLYFKFLMLAKSFAERKYKVLLCFKNLQLSGNDRFVIYCYLLFHVTRDIVHF